MNTSWFETLETVLDSKTISPNYSLPHVICVLFEIYASGEGIGRYQLKDRVGLGEGSLRTLLKRLEKHGIISVKKKRAGHMLSAKVKISGQLCWKFFNSQRFTIILLLGYIISGPKFIIQ